MTEPCSRGRFLGALTASLVLLGLLLAPPSQAGCGGVRVAEPAHRHHGQRPPLAIGDSTMLLALYQLAGAGYEADAHGCRQLPEAMAILRQRKAHNSLPHMVVIALGADGSVSHRQIGEVLGLLCCSRLLVLVTPRELGGGSGADAAAVRGEASRHPGRVLLLDWVRYSAGHGSWFQPDGIHLTAAGAVAFTRLFRTALPYAYPLPKRKRDWGATTVGGDPHAGAITGRMTSAGLALQTSTAGIGYVSVSITGPAGAQVQVSEQLPGGATKSIALVGLGPAGEATLPRALRWDCDQRERRILASVSGPPPEPAASASVLTPSCSRRLSVHISRSAAVGGVITVKLGDRWRIGGLRVMICLGPPGARALCRPWWLQASQASRTIAFSAPRPGGWTISAGTRYQAARTRVVWVSHRSSRIRLLAAGDSEMQILDGFLQQDLGSHRVDVSSDARISTGLTNSFFFDWQAHARRQAAGLRPDVTVMFMGANDGFAVPGPHGRVGCCGLAWSTGYAAMVARMMHTYLRGASGRVLWFLLPAPRPGNFQSLFGAVNAGIRMAARRFPGRVELVDDAALFTPGGHYRDFMTYHGRGLVIHEPDGIHLSIASDRIAASLVVRQLRADRIIR